MIEQVRGTRYGKTIDQLLDEIIAVTPQRVTHFNDTTALLEGFKSGRVVAILVASEIASYVRSRRDNPDCGILDLSPFARKQPGGLMMSKKLITRKEAAKWNELVQGMCADGTLIKIIRRNSGAPELNPIMCNLPGKGK